MVGIGSSIWVHRDYICSQDLAIAKYDTEELVLDTRQKLLNERIYNLHDVENLSANGRPHRNCHTSICFDDGWNNDILLLNADSKRGHLSGTIYTKHTRDIKSMKASV